MNDQRDDVGYFVAVLPAGCGGVMSEPISENGFAPKFAFKLRSCSILLHQSKPGNLPWLSGGPAEKEQCLW